MEKRRKERGKKKKKKRKSNKKGRKRERKNRFEMRIQISRTGEQQQGEDVLYVLWSGEK